ncbi:MAG: M20/M25/M40 family metallo-hydrolase [Ardenticatenaceae bacterium]|nr:M20/M25/M40 family metallo-hydrolase [Ardenticatenaceae bacterium]
MRRDDPAGRLPPGRLSGRAALRTAVWQRLAAREDELVALCQQLVRIPSVNGVHFEQGVVDAVAAALRVLGLAPEMPTFEPGRPNVVATLGTGRAGLLFLAHSDTVAVGESSHWTVDPFGGEVRAGRLYSRGACDNKAGLAVAVVLLGILHEFEAELNGRVLLACIPDEESGATGRLGIMPLLEAGLLSATQAIYTYPGLDVLAIGHRGLLRLRARAIGEAAHTGGDEWERGERGANAVTAMARLLLAVEQWQPPFQPSPAFPNRRPVITPGTLIRGGRMESMVPPDCEAMIDMRLLPGQESQTLIEEVRAMADAIARERPRVHFEIETPVDLPAAFIPAETPIVQRLAHWAEALTGRRPAIAGVGPANEGYLLIQAGIPTVCGFGPPGGNAHAADEYVEVAGLLLAAKIYAAAALDLLME